MRAKAKITHSYDLIRDSLICRSSRKSISGETTWQIRCSHRLVSLTPLKVSGRLEGGSSAWCDWTRGSMLDLHGRAGATGEAGNSASSVQGWQRRWTRHGGQTTSSRSMESSGGPIAGRTEGGRPRQDCLCELHDVAVVRTTVLDSVVVSMTAKTGYSRT